MLKFLKLGSILILVYVFVNCENVCYKGDTNCAKDKQLRFLFYDVNRPEGFNLRRDVYMRFAVLANNMRGSKDPLLNSFRLVLPPWSHLVHWRYREHPEYKPWGLYFDIESLQMFAPVIEMHEFFSNYEKRYSKVIIDEVYTLQHFEDMFETGNFQDRMKIDECVTKDHYTFFFYKNMTSNNFQCLSYHGSATKLTKLLVNTTANSILINHAEVALHDFFGNKVYWEARRSMRFNKMLRQIAGEFRMNLLKSSDETDNTVLPDHWKDEKPRRNAVGGPYLAVHLRRRDFVRSRSTETPSLNSVIHQIKGILEKIGLDTVFVATDAPYDEFDMLSKGLPKYNVIKYISPKAVEDKYGEGGLAIIDQIICSYARYFVGTHESTFTFRIQEEREIIGFPSETTFNVFCKDENNCFRPSVWKIVY